MDDSRHDVEKKGGGGIAKSAVGSYVRVKSFNEGAEAVWEPTSADDDAEPTMSDRGESSGKVEEYHAGYPEGGVEGVGSSMSVNFDGILDEIAAI